MVVVDLDELRAGLSGKLAGPRNWHDIIAETMDDGGRCHGYELLERQVGRLGTAERWSTEQQAEWGLGGPHGSEHRGDASVARADHQLRLARKNFAYHFYAPREVESAAVRCRQLITCARDGLCFAPIGSRFETMTEQDARTALVCGWRSDLRVP